MLGLCNSLPDQSYTVHSTLGGTKIYWMHTEYLGIEAKWCGDIWQAISYDISVKKLNDGWIMMDHVMLIEHSLGS